MTVQTACPTFVTSRLAEARAFYVAHFDAHIAFDCGWYVVLRLSGPDGPELCFMEPRKGTAEYQGGATLNLCVADVDAVYERLVRNGLKPLAPPEDHPWGDRSFSVTDPCGLLVCCYRPIEPDEAFKHCFR